MKGLLCFWFDNDHLLTGSSHGEKDSFIGASLPWPQLYFPKALSPNATTLIPLSAKTP
jgi:hypothetical protein